MRILADISSNAILQVEKNSPLGTPISHNGRYSIPVPEGVSVKVRPGSVVLPSSSPNSVIQQGYAGLLAQMPYFEHILFNPLIEATDMDDLDFSGILNEGSPAIPYGPRFQVGRGTGGPLPAGHAPNSVAILEQNNTVAPPKPGVLVTDTIDLSVLTGGAGAADFAVYWYVYEFDTTVDVRSTVGTFANQNNPSIRQLIETDQEASDFEVFISVNGGANFFPVERLVPISFCSPTNAVKLAFKNTGSVKKYLATYAVLF